MFLTRVQFRQVLYTTISASSSARLPESSSCHCNTIFTSSSGSLPESISGGCCTLPSLPVHQLPCQSQVPATTLPSSQPRQVPYQSPFLAGTLHHYLFQLLSTFVRLKFLPLHYHLHKLTRFLTRVHFWQVLYTTISSAPLLDSSSCHYTTIFTISSGSLPGYTEHHYLCQLLSTLVRVKLLQPHYHLPSAHQVPYQSPIPAGTVHHQLLQLACQSN